MTIEQAPIDKLYNQLWKEQDIKVGIYNKPSDTVEDANENTILQLIKIMPSLKKSTNMLMIGSGFGDVARYIVEKHGCHIDCLNPDPKENKIHQKKNDAAGIEGQIEVLEGDYSKTPHKLGHYDIIWSQDTLIHQEHKQKIFRDLARILKPEGRLIFTALLLDGDLTSKIKLRGMLPLSYSPDLLSANKYDRFTSNADLEKVFIKKMPNHLSAHYQKILEVMENNAKKVKDANFLETMQTELKNSLSAIEQGYLTWGILQFQKRNV
ncbi:MAG: methyltransferase domain-containing protein [Bacteroidota bacterium]